MSSEEDAMKGLYIVCAPRDGGSSALVLSMLRQLHEGGHLRSPRTFTVEAPIEIGLRSVQMESHRPQRTARNSPGAE